MSAMELEFERRQRATGLAQDLIAKDMMQARILSAMFDAAAKRELIVKGGFAMRAAHGSHRYTKDIDLQTGPSTPMARVKNLVETAIANAEKAGIFQGPATVTAPKQTETVQRWKISGKIAGGGSEVHLTVEVSRRGMPDPKYTSSIAYAPSGEGLKAVMMEVYSPTAIAAAKVDCLLNPNRVATRDVFDLNLLISMRVDPPIQLLRLMGKDALVAGLKEVWSKLEVMDWDLAQSDLKPFLARGQMAELTEESWDEMRIRTGEAVCSWIQAALDEEERSEGPPGP